MQPDFHRMISRALTGLLIVCFFVARPARAASDQQVSLAIQKAVKYLRQTCKNGNWEVAPPDYKALNPQGAYSEAAQYGGRTALGAYALLAAGEKAKDDPELESAIKWLKTADLRGTYAVGLRAQVWLLTENFKGKTELIDADKQFLLDSLIQKGEGAGFYGYSWNPAGAKRGGSRMKFGEGGPPKDNFYDRSNSQYGVLGLWALQQAGAEIPSKYWEIVDASWRAAQHHDGGWDYRPEDEKGSAPTMTAAGIATLFITQDYLLLGHHWEPCAGGVVNNNIENGLLKMEKPVQALLTTGNYYGMYGVERIGTASGRKYFGTNNWYEVGAEFLVGHQQADGSWNGQYGPQIDGSFGLIFLSRGRAPVMMNKCQYVNTGKNEKELNPWNERPRDVANITRWMGAREEGYLNWQVVNLTAPVGELHDSPILYLSGNKELKLSEPDKKKLKDFAESGGLILANADCNSIAFTKSFESMGESLFPKYKFRQLPNNHPIFEEDFSPRRWHVPVTLRGLSNGARELMLVMPTGDIGRSWQTDSSKTHQEAFEMTADLYLYAVDKKSLYFKGTTYYVKADPSIVTTKVPIARLIVDEKGNWDPEPGGWQRLAAIFHNQRKIDLDVQPITLGAGKLAPFKVAHLTGSGKLILKADQIQELKDFVEKGGTLIVDADGGDATFAQTAQENLTLMFPDAIKSLETDLPMESPVFTVADKITTVTYRSFATRQRVGNSKVARLKGIPVAGGRIGVFYSAEDLSTGLVGEPVDGIVGYDPATATSLMTNMIYYGAKLTPPTTQPKPTTKTSPTPDAAPKPPAADGGAAPAAKG